MLIPSNNMNIRVNQRFFRKYPKDGPMPEVSVAPFPVLFDVVKLSRCSANDLQEVVLRALENSRSRHRVVVLVEEEVVAQLQEVVRSRHQVVILAEEAVAQLQEVVLRLDGEVVDWGGNQQSCKDAPQKPDCSLSCAGSSACRVLEA
jgi:glycerol-3-phosphate dehydrogenase